LGFGLLGLGPGPHPPRPNPQSPIPNPQSPVFLLNINNLVEFNEYKIYLYYQQIFILNNKIYINT